MCEIEPCGCDESNALRDVLEDVLTDSGRADDCPADCTCSWRRAVRLLEHLKAKRAAYHAAGGQTMRFIKIEFTIGDIQKQGEFKWE